MGSQTLPEGTCRICLRTLRDSPTSPSNRDPGVIAIQHPVFPKHLLAASKPQQQKSTTKPTPTICTGRDYDRVVYVMRQLACCLKEVHDRGVCHLDVSARHFLWAKADSEFKWFVSLAVATQRRPTDTTQHRSAIALDDAAHGTPADVPLVCPPRHAPAHVRVSPLAGCCCCELSGRLHHSRTLKSTNSTSPRRAATARTGCWPTSVRQCSSGRLRWQHASPLTHPLSMYAPPSMTPRSSLWRRSRAEAVAASSPISRP